MPLCKVCAALPLNFFLKPRSSCLFHESLTSLSDSAAAGCNFCMIIWWAANDAKVRLQNKEVAVREDGGLQDGDAEDKIADESIKHDRSAKGSSSEENVAQQLSFEDRPLADSGTGESTSERISAEENRSKKSENSTHDNMRERSEVERHRRPSRIRDDIIDGNADNRKYFKGNTGNRVSEDRSSIHSSSEDEISDVSSIGYSSSEEDNTNLSQGITLVRSWSYPSEGICMVGKDFDRIEVALFEYSHKNDRKLPFGTDIWWQTADGDTDWSKTRKNKYMLEQKALKLKRKEEEQLRPPGALADCTIVQCDSGDFFDIRLREEKSEHVRRASNPQVPDYDSSEDEGSENEYSTFKDRGIKDRGKETTASEFPNEKLNIRPLLGRPEESISLIRAWIDNCVKSHKLCKESGTERYIPTRVLSVGKHDDRSVQLVETSHSEEFETYLALSHCWGELPLQDKIKMTTTTSNLSNRLEYIPLTSLPKSFIDAIHITRQLGEAYLWIDSLCIIQDSVDDWERESRVMGLIYGNALCTLAAAEAKNSNEGIFRPRDEIPPSLNITLPVHYQEDSEEHHIFLHPIFPSYQATVPYTPLATRAWVLQERQLSRRLVTITANQVFWECTCSSASETAPQEGLGPGLEEMYVPSFDQSTGPAKHRQLQATIKSWAEMTPDQEDQMRSEMGDVNPPSPYMDWYTLVSVFTHRSITNEMDTLPALAGMSSDLARRVGGHYVAGLWKEDMMFGLAWRPSGKSTRPASWRAPSWSWASLNGPVTFSNEFPKPTPLNITAVEASSSPRSTLNPYGAVTNASLKVRGFIKAGIWGPHGSFDLPHVSWIQPDGSRAEPSKNDFSLIYYDTEEDEDNYYGSEKAVYCMYVGTCVWHGPLGLALIPTEENSDEYRRVGWIRVARDFFDEFSEAWMSIEESGALRSESTDRKSVV